MLFSRECEYALQATLYLAGDGSRGTVPVNKIARILHIPYPFLAKIAQKLTRKKIFRSVRGPAGGVRLAMNPASISLYSIVEAIDGSEGFRRCMLGLPRCNDSAPCPMHTTWGPARERIKGKLQKTTTADFAGRSRDLALWIGRMAATSKGKTQ